MIHAIGRGSRVKSPFLHTTRDLGVALKWMELGCKDRRDWSNYLVRIKRAMVEDVLLDMSTKELQEMRLPARYHQHQQRGPTGGPTGGATGSQRGPTGDPHGWPTGTQRGPPPRDF